MTLSLAWRLARRELRAGLRGFYVLILCLILGVAAIAGVTSVRDSIALGLAREGGVLLGGDVEMTFTYRFASDAERAWIVDNSAALSQIADFRSMLTFGETRALTQVKAVDAAYPLTGAIRLTPDQPLAGALTPAGGMPGILLDPVLAQRLGVTFGDQVQLGAQRFIYTAQIDHEPDGAGGGFSLGPRSIVALDALEGSGLLAPGTLFETAYRFETLPQVNLDTLEAAAQTALPERGFRWRDRRNGAPGIARFVDRLSAFLVLVGLAGLAVGGVGVSGAVRSYLERKTAVIATLKTLGATRAMIFAIYLMQIGVLTVIALAIGLALGAAIPALLAPIIQAQIPVPLATGLHLRPLFEAALYGLLAASIFVLWPLAQSERIRPAALYRDAQLGLSIWPRWPFALLSGALLAALIFCAVYFADNTRLVLWTFAGLGLTFFALLVVAQGVAALCRRLARVPMFHGRTALRLALGAVGGPGGETRAIILSLGLGLTVLSAIGQIDANMRSAIDRDLPTRAPAYFVVDIQPDQIAPFRARLSEDPGVTDFESAPMLRGVITQINGKPAREVAGDHWVLQGDRGLTYAAAQPGNAEVTEGAWWPETYTGPPQISFAAEEAAEMGLALGDTMTINVLGRDITGDITSFRNVDFSGAGMGFILTMNDAALAGAPHSHIATIYAETAAEAPLINDLTKRFPNITTIRVRDAIDRVVAVLESIAAATTMGAAMTLITGGVVLLGAAAASATRRQYEAAILKTLGARQRYVLWSFTLRALFVGIAAGLVALGAGVAAAYGVIEFVMDASFELSIGAALATITLGVLLTIATSLLVSARAMRVPPARLLRSTRG